MITKEEAQKEIEKLVQRFDEQKESYKKNYNEAQTRGDFINPLWKALNWDVYNESGYAEGFREVILEDSLKMRGTTKHPDYSFRLGNGTPLFFLEAKKPSTDIKNDKDIAHQIRRYGWNAGMSISIVTNFEEFAVYDCTIKPRPTDKASIGRIEYIHYSKYISEFDFIWDTFNKENVLRGSLDKYIQSNKSKKRTITVDKDFLTSLDKWRIKIATNIACCNKGISEDKLNFIVQQLIDRIIFLRIAEDRNIEPYETLKTHIKKGNYYKNLFKQFEYTDGKYNSGLFDFKKDTISKNIKIDNKIIQTIIDELYYPKSPYEFSVISVEILGKAYEQFLGKQILLSKSGNIRITEKPEVRKAGGVYYTPQYIVNYIVENSIGKLIENKTPKEVGNIKIVDPACGSGSFLIGAYQYLLNWHKDYYTKNNKPSKGNKNNPLTPEGELATAEKKRILLNNIYGVDLDSNAVEVTKLSLLLKCMEGETQASITQLGLFNERVLPTLDENIKNGNSLIDFDYYDDNKLDFGEDRKVIPFPWKKNFPEVFKQGGFDCIIGNPPYVIVFNDKIKNYLETNYSVFQRNNDLYVAFIAKCLKLVKPKGIFSMITPNSFIRGDYFKALRQLFNQYQINEIVNFGNKLIFDETNVFTCIFNITNDKPNKSWVMKSDLNVFKANIDADSEVYIFKNKLIQKLDKLKKFDNYFFVKDVGYNYWSKGRGKQRGDSIGSRILYEGKKENSRDIPYLKGRNFNRYTIDEPTQFLRHNYEKYLDKNDIFRFTSEILEAEVKLIYRQTSSHLVGTLETNKYHNDKTVHVILPKDGYDVNLKFVLGIFNSKLLNYYYSMLVEEEGRAFAQVKIDTIKQLPYVEVDIKQQAQIIKHVDQLLHLNKELQIAILPNQIEQLQSKISYSEDIINALVYEFYGLIGKEIKIVEDWYKSKLCDKSN